MLLKYVTLVSGFNFLLFAIILIFKQSPVKKPNLYLGITFLMMTAFCFDLFYLQQACLRKSHLLLSFYVPLDYLLAMLMAPGIYFYVTIVLNKTVSIRLFKTWSHFIPAIPPLIFIVYFMLLPVNTRVDKLMTNFYETIWQGNILNGLFYLQMTSYLFVCYFIISRQIRASRYVLINSVRINIHWLKNFFLIDIIMMLATAPICFLVNNDQTNTIIGQVVMNVQFIYIFIKANWQKGVFSVEKIIEPELPRFTEPSLKLAENVADNYFELLLNFMQNERPYLQKGCTIHVLADGTKIPIHHLSNILNNRLNKNFFDFINEYRIEEAKKMLHDKKYSLFTIEAIAFECGFGSKTTFNKAFKEITNQIPSEFRHIGSI